MNAVNLANIISIKINRMPLPINEIKPVKFGMVTTTWRIVETWPTEGPIGTANSILLSGEDFAYIAKEFYELVADRSGFGGGGYVSMLELRRDEEYYTLRGKGKTVTAIHTEVKIAR